MRAGKLDRRATLERATLAVDDVGQPLESWEVVDTVWAGKRDLRGREFYAARAVNAEASTVWEIRWREDVTVLDRLVVEGVTYRILHVAEIGRRQGLQLMCSATVPP